MEENALDKEIYLEKNILKLIKHKTLDNTSKNILLDGSHDDQDNE